MSYCTKFGIYKNVTIMELLALQRFLNYVDTQWIEKTTTKNYHYYFEKKVKMEIDIVVSSQTTATAPLPSTKWIVQIS